MQVTNDKEIREQFASQKYAKIDSLIEGGLCEMLYAHVVLRSPGGQPAAGTGMDGAVELPYDPVMEHVLGGLQPRVEELSGLSLHPTYSFCRVYRRGNVLERHHDRESCEVSVSLNLGPALQRPWPLWVAGPQGETGVELAPGDALLYRGIECDHWREALEADHLAQVFLHYVDRDGPYRDWKFDRRSSLGV